MKLKDILKTAKEIEQMGYKIENNIIEEININIIGHFCNAVCLEIFCSNVVPLGGYNNTQNNGYVIRAIIELFCVEKEDGLRITDVKNIPCRLVFKGCKCVGFGHFMKDRFVITEDFAKVDE